MGPIRDGLDRVAIVAREVVGQAVEPAAIVEAVLLARDETLRRPPLNLSRAIQAFPATDATLRVVVDDRIDEGKVQVRLDVVSLPELVLARRDAESDEATAPQDDALGRDVEARRNVLQEVVISLIVREGTRRRAEEVLIDQPSRFLGGQLEEFGW
ncbi:hypothetical protein [Aquisphaera giovannonii]|uniref:hypothetical protein n=1 Tax=Aquisphaera giovannonii TaxID=406548 RepID=UPI0011DF0DF6|nr:hypothetical protein [Aquisphaera giovannonii]